MAKPPTNRVGSIPIKYRPDRDKWELTIHTNGKRSRTLYATEDEAGKAWAAHLNRLKRFGTDAGAVTPSDLAELAEARRIIPGVDLRDAARFYRHHHPEGVESSTVPDAVAAYLEHQSRKSLSKRHYDGLRLHCELFAELHADRDLRSITGNELLAWLAGLKLDPRTVRNYAGSLSAFFAWAERRGMVALSPAKAIHDADLPAARPKPKGVLSVDQSAALMDFMAAHYPRYVPWHALQLFAGIRRAEVGRMTWDLIDLERETVRRAVRARVVIAR